MKKDLLFSCFILLIVFCFSTAHYAQSNLSSTGRAPISHQSPNFSYLKIMNSPITQCRYAYYYNAITYMVGKFPDGPGCPGGDLALYTGPTFASAGVQGGNGNFYLLDAGPPSSLCQLDTSNGSVTILGQVTGIGSAVANGIAYNVVNNSYYVCSYSGSTNNLYKLDINTLAATLISSIGSPGSPMIAIAINSSGVGYGYEIMPDNNAYTFDPVTGASALLGPIGFEAGFAQDMDVDIETGIIYLAAYNVNTNSGELRIMDPNTGMTTLVSLLPDQISVFEFDNNYTIVPVELTSILAPLVFSLEQNYPNPFNPSTKIKFTVPNVIASGSKQSQLVILIVYDILGNEVATLVNEERTAGTYEVEFSGHSDEGQNLPSGVYFYQLRIGGSEMNSGQAMIQTRKMILLK